MGKRSVFKPLTSPFCYSILAAVPLTKLEVFSLLHNPMVMALSVVVTSYWPHNVILFNASSYCALIPAQGYLATRIDTVRFVLKYPKL